MIEQPIAIAAIMAVAQTIKKMGFPSKYLPIVNLILGVIIGFFLYEMNIDGLLKGLIIGASAGGIFDFNKSCFSRECLKKKTE